MGTDFMPRQARLDAPGTLHHVIIRGIEKKEIVTDIASNTGVSTSAVSKMVNKSINK